MKNIRISLFIILFAAACKGKPATTSNAESAGRQDETTVILDSIQKKNAGILTDTVITKSLYTTIKVNGVVDVPPQSLLSVSFPMGGYLKSTELLPGAPVTKGQVIAIMENAAYVQLQQDYFTAKAKMDYLATDMQRQKELSDADATSKKNFQLALSDFKIQQALLKSLDEKLRLIHIDPDKLTIQHLSGAVPIYSPITGFVSKVNVNIGKYVNPTDVLFELVNPDDMHAAITVFEKDINQFKKGLKGKVALSDKPDEWYGVKTILVSRNVNENRSGTVHCHFDKPGHHLLPGMFLNAEFEMNSELATVIPEDAVVRYMGKEYIFVTNDEKVFHLTTVSTGARANGEVALQTDHKNYDGSKIVVHGAYALLGKLKNKAGEE